MSSNDQHNKFFPLPDLSIDPFCFDDEDLHQIISDSDSKQKSRPSGKSSEKTTSTSQSHRRPSSRTETEERKFGCELCNSRFRTRSDFQKHHENVHLRIRRHVCRTCGARFGERGNLTRHERRHEGVRSFSCSFPNCHSSFVLRDGLVRHERTVHRFWPRKAQGGSVSAKSEPTTSPQAKRSSQK